MFTLRPMAGDDEARLLRFHAQLSRETTYSRFFSVHPELSPAEVYRFTHVDHLGREAFVAVDDEDEIVGVGRYDRLADGAAEVAFVVRDDWQGQGVGRALFDAVAERARAVGITRLVAETQIDNQRMLSVFRHAGLPERERFAHGVKAVELDL